MTRRPLIAGNWKMNKTPQETEEFIHRFLGTLPEGTDCDVLLIPPFTSLDRAGILLLESTVSLGAQDVYYETSGAYTGAISAGMLAACGCEYALVGHSERRHVFGDSDDAVRRKLDMALASGLRPVLCIGETLDEREHDRTVAVLEHQLEKGLRDIDDVALERIVIAYEPVWAIGTGETASPEHAQTAIHLVRMWIRAAFGKRAHDEMRILYGGSVKPDNVARLQSQPDIDGMLIGGASLDPDSFAQIVSAAAAVRGDDTGC